MKKHSINIVLAIIAFIVLGCTCSSTGNVETTNTKVNASRSEDKSDTKSPVDSSTPDSNNETEENDDTSSSDNSNNSNNKSTMGTPKKYDDNDVNDTVSKIPTLAQFNRIKQGMTYNEVVDIIGFEGQLVKTDRYIWGDNNRFIMISFANNKVFMATQNGLE